MDLEKIINILACPDDQGLLRLKNDNLIVCKLCEREFNIVEGISILFPKMITKLQKITFYIATVIYLLLPLAILNTLHSDRLLLSSILRNISIQFYYRVIAMFYLLSNWSIQFWRFVTPYRKAGL